MAQISAIWASHGACEIERQMEIVNAGVFFSHVSFRANWFVAECITGFVEMSVWCIFPQRFYDEHLRLDLHDQYPRSFM